MEIYFGPVRDVPSWYWVGRDVADALSSQHRIKWFNDIGELPDYAVVFWIKCPAGIGAGAAIRDKRLRIVFFPVDVFEDPAHLERCRDFTDACALVVLHAKNLLPFFSHQPVRFIDHYNKYGIDPGLRRPNGELLWIGGFQHFPYVVRLMLETGLHRQHTIRFLTDFNKPAAIAAANALGRQLGLGMDCDRAAVTNGLVLEEWSEASQCKLLLSCSAAFDYKDDRDFNQMHKPPTKLQKFVCSNIPCALNDSSALRTSLGFELCDVRDTDTWFGSAYQQRVAAAGQRLRPTLSLPAIVAGYLDFAEEVRAPQMVEL